MSGTPSMIRHWPRVVAILPSRNDENFLGTTLLSLFEETAEYTRLGGTACICVVNDGSTDRTGAVADGMRRLSPVEFVVINRKDPRGNAYSLNEGVAACARPSDLVLRADPDARFIKAGWLRAMVAFLLSDDRIGMVAPISLFPDGTIDAHGIDYLPAGRTIRLHEQEYGTQTIDPLVEVDAVQGVYALSRACDWEVDPGYYAWRDDEDQCLALRRRGRKCFSMGLIEVVHYQRLRWARVSDRITIAHWAKRQHQQRPKPPQPGRWKEFRYGVELLAAALLPSSLKKALRTMVAPAPPPIVEQPQTDEGRVDAAWKHDSLHFAHKWGFPTVDARMDVDPAARRVSAAYLSELAESRAAAILQPRYTERGIAEARAIIERHLVSMQTVPTS